MMVYRCETAQGKAIELKNPAYVKLSMDEDAPAHSLVAEFPLEAGAANMLEEYHTLRLYESIGNQPVFVGLVDEQKISYSGDGCFLTLYARSLAALLLDNEAAPQTYYLPSVSLIAGRHAKPYGFTAIYNKDRSFSAKMQVSKGMSEWETIRLFCRDYLKTRPFVTLTGELLLERRDPQEQLVFSNQGGIAFSEAVEQVIRYRRLSEVLVKPDKRSGYSVRIEDAGAKESGIRRRRLLNAEQSEQAPPLQGAALLETARRQSYAVTLTCPGQRIFELGTKAALQDPFTGKQEGLEVAGVCYRLDGNGERTELVLRRKE